MKRITIYFGVFFSLLFSCTGGEERKEPGSKVLPLIQDPMNIPGCEVLSVKSIPVSSPDPVDVCPCGDPGCACPEAAGIDVDGDGVPSRYDCNDADGSISPLAPDRYCDGIDQNCNGFDECDSDHDGVLDIDDCDMFNTNSGLECKPYFTTRVEPTI